MWKVLWSTIQRYANYMLAIWWTDALAHRKLASWWHCNENVLNMVDGAVLGCSPKVGTSFHSLPKDPILKQKKKSVRLIGVSTLFCLFL